MSRRVQESSNDRLFCWEQVLRVRPAFRVTQVFAPTELKERLLPLYALFALVELAGSHFTEEDLARSKLSWWRLELLGRGAADSAHPVLRELARSGAAERLPTDAISALLAGTEQRLQAAPPADLDALMTVCREIHAPQRALEEAVCDLSPETPHQLAAADAEAGLLQLLRESARRPQHDAFWWLPLPLLAKHGISRTEVAGSRGKGAAAALLGEIRAEAARAGRATPGRREVSAQRPAAVRHLAVTSMLSGRQLGRMTGLAPADWPKQLSAAGLRDLVAVWNTARRYAA